MAQTMAETLTERGRKLGRSEGIETGMERGMERGRELGRVEEKQAGLLRIIQTLFQIPPETLTPRVRAITDLDHLDTLFDRALTAASFDDIDWEDNTP